MPTRASHEVGSLTPGNEADITLIRTTDVNTARGTNPVATVTAFAYAGNVDRVLVAGQIPKWRGKVTGHDMNAVTANALASGDYVATLGRWVAKARKQGGQGTRAGYVGAGAAGAA